MSLNLCEIDCKYLQMENDSCYYIFLLQVALYSNGHPVYNKPKSNKLYNRFISTRIESCMLIFPLKTTSIKKRRDILPIKE